MSSHKILFATFLRTTNDDTLPACRNFTALHMPATHSPTTSFYTDHSFADYLHTSLLQLILPFLPSSLFGRLLSLCLPVCMCLLFAWDAFFFSGRQTILPGEEVSLHVLGQHFAEVATYKTGMKSSSPMRRTLRVPFRPCAIHVSFLKHHPSPLQNVDRNRSGNSE